MNTWTETQARILSARAARSGAKMGLVSPRAERQRRQSAGPGACGGAAPTPKGMVAGPRRGSARGRGRSLGRRRRQEKETSDSRARR